MYTVLEHNFLFGFPTQSFVEDQAVLNVLNGERYKMVPKEINDYLHGKYGASPAPVDEAIRHKIIGDDKVITHRPADDLAPEFKSLKAQISVTPCSIKVRIKICAPFNFIIFSLFFS